MPAINLISTNSHRFIVTIPVRNP